MWGVDVLPRVARASQPWAGGHNPFGIGTGFLQEEAEKAESGWRKRRFFAAWTSFPLSFSPLTSAFFAFSAVKQSPSFPLFASVRSFSPPFVPIRGIRVKARFSSQHSTLIT